MNLLRRQFLHLAAGAAALPAAERIAWAQAYPSRPVHLIVGFPASGLTDILARLLGSSLSERLGQQFIVEDRPGAGTNLATEAAVRALPDGYTLLMASSSNAINATLYDNLKFNFIRDTTPVASIARTPLVLVVNPSFPAKSVPELINYAKASPGKINMATAVIGSSLHLAGELFMTMTGVKFVPVHYRSLYVPDLLAGQVQLAFSPIPTTIEQVRAGNPCGDQPDTFVGVAERPDHRRVRRRLRGKRMEWRGRAEGHIPRDHRQAPRSNRCGPRRSQVDDAIRRRRQRSKVDDACRFWQVHCRRHREVGQSHTREQYQCRVSEPALQS